MKRIAIGVTLFLWALIAQALSLPQLTTLKAAILANPTCSVPYQAGNDLQTAECMNQTAVPSFTVWKTRMTVEDANKLVNWTEYIGRSAGERDAWGAMWRTGAVNPADLNVRQGFADMFSGASGVNTRTALLAAAKRLATLAEKALVLVGVGFGVGTNADPATMTFEGLLSPQDIRDTRTEV